MGYYFHFPSFLGEKTFYVNLKFRIKSIFLFCLIFQFCLMYRLICQKPAHFLSAQMALVSTFFKCLQYMGCITLVLCKSFCFSSLRKLNIMKPMIFCNQEKSAYVATISKSLHIHYTNEVRQGQKRKKQEAQQEEKKAILKGDLGQLCVD